jgi:flagellar biosynthesis anti-sigma factor FlgM
MRIDSNQSGPVVSESNRSSPGTQATDTGSSAASTIFGQDQAQLSGTHVLALAAQASQLPDVREEKVSALRQAVQSGSYQASPDKVAEALFSYLLGARAA